MGVELGVLGEDLRLSDVRLGGISDDKYARLLWENVGQVIDKIRFTWLSSDSVHETIGI
jgi:hypothetical protein